MTDDGHFKIPPGFAQKSLIQFAMARLRSGLNVPMARGDFLISTVGETRTIRATKFSDVARFEVGFEFELSIEEAEWLGEKLTDFAFALAAVEREENGEIN